MKIIWVIWLLKGLGVSSVLPQISPYCMRVCVCLICVLIFRYVGNLQRIFDYSPLDPSQDFATQM